MLILVVAALCLLTLIGTAYLITTRTDRHAVAQHGSHTQLDLLV